MFGKEALAESEDYYADRNSDSTVMVSVVNNTKYSTI